VPRSSPQQREKPLGPSDADGAPTRRRAGQRFGSVPGWSSGPHGQRAPDHEAVQDSEQRSTAHRARTPCEQPRRRFHCHDPPRAPRPSGAARGSGLPTWTRLFAILRFRYFAKRTARSQASRRDTESPADVRWPILDANVGFRRERALTGVVAVAPVLPSGIAPNRAAVGSRSRRREHPIGTCAPERTCLSRGGMPQLQRRPQR
jgi:hypothetical protein